MKTIPLAVVTVIGVTALPGAARAQDSALAHLPEELASHAQAVAARMQDPAWVRDLADRLAREAEAVAARAAAQESRLARQVAAGIARQAQAMAQEAERLAQRAQQRRGAAERRAEEPKGQEVTEPFSRTVPLEREGTFSLENVAGTVVVTGGGENVRIEALKRARGATEAAARSVLRQLQIRVTERGDRVDVRTEFPRRMRAGVGGVDYTIHVPNGAHVTLRNLSGDVRVKNIDGELRAETVSGNIDASAVRLVRQARSVTGTIQMTGANGAEVNAGTVSGDIVLRGLKARGVDLQSVSGNLRLTDVDIERAQSRSVSGAIEYAGRMAKGGRYEFRSHSGTVRVVPAGGAGFDVEANTFTGDIRSDYALRLLGAPGPGRGLPRPRSIRGSFGDGGATLAIQSFSGNIVIVKQ
jgi:hypothetical protein